MVTKIDELSKGKVKILNTFLNMNQQDRGFYLLAYRIKAGNTEFYKLLRVLHLRKAKEDKHDKI